MKLDSLFGYVINLIISQHRLFIIKRRSIGVTNNYNEYDVFILYIRVQVCVYPVVLPIEK